MKIRRIFRPKSPQFALAWGIQFHAEVSAADAMCWIGEFQVDPDAVAMGIDSARLHAETAPRIADWNRLGRELCSRFLDVVAARQGSRVALGS